MTHGASTPGGSAPSPWIAPDWSGVPRAVPCQPTVAPDPPSPSLPVPRHGTPTGCLDFAARGAGFLASVSLLAHNHHEDVARPGAVINNMARVNPFTANGGNESSDPSSSFSPVFFYRCNVVKPRLVPFWFHPHFCRSNPLSCRGAWPHTPASGGPRATPVALPPPLHPTGRLIPGPMHREGSVPPIPHSVRWVTTSLGVGPKPCPPLFQCIGQTLHLIFPSKSRGHFTPASE